MNILVITKDSWSRKFIEKYLAARKILVKKRRFNISFSSIEDLALRYSGFTSSEGSAKEVSQISTTKEFKTIKIKNVIKAFEDKGVQSVYTRLKNCAFVFEIGTFTKEEKAFINIWKEFIPIKTFTTKSINKLIKEFENEDPESYFRKPVRGAGK